MGKENHYNCIYMYENKINGKKYIGQTTNFNRRCREHLNGDYLIDKAIKKYGIENFDITILHENLTFDEMNYWEKKYIKDYNTLAKFKMGYNISEGGHNGNPFAGKSDEWMENFKKDCSKRFSGENNPMFGIHITGENHHQYGIPLSEQTRQKISDTRNKNNIGKGEKHPLYGKKHSEESKKKMSESQKKLNNTGENNYFYGHHHTDEVKQKQRKEKGTKIRAIHETTNEISEQLSGYSQHSGAGPL